MRGRNLAATRLFFATDVHGSERCWLKFVNAAKAYGAQVLVMGGDLTAKSITPIFAEEGGWAVERPGFQRRLKRRGELAEAEGEIRASGSYPLETTREEWSEATADPARMERLFERLALESIDRWLAIAEERLMGQGVLLVINAGNDDFPSVHQRLEASGFAIHGEGRVVDLDGHHAMISCGYANMTPWRCPGDLPEEELAARIEAMVDRLGDPSTALFNLHCPPRDTPLDLAPRLGEDLTPVLAPGGEVEMAHVGSAAVRSALERYQPLLGLHGHIHESRGFVKVGRTLAINPGSSYGEGILQGALVDLTPRGIGSYLLTSG